MCKPKSRPKIEKNHDYKHWQTQDAFILKLTNNWSKKNGLRQNQQMYHFKFSIQMELRIEKLHKQYPLQIRYSLVVILELNSVSEVQYKEVMIIDDECYEMLWTQTIFIFFFFYFLTLQEFCLSFLFSDDEEAHDITVT